MSDEKEANDNKEANRVVTEKEFAELWSMSFEDLARAAATGTGYTARRFILQCRQGEAELQSTRWTRWGVVVALVAASASFSVAILDLAFG